MPAKKRKESVPALSFSSEKFDPEKYADVARKARLLEVCLNKQAYEVKIRCFWNSVSDQDDLKQRFLGEPIGSYYDEESSVLVGGYRWKAEIKQKRKTALKLSAEYMLAYRGLEAVDKDYARLYFEKIARFTTYPYFRALFSMMSSNSGLALEPLPTLIDRVD